MNPLWTPTDTAGPASAGYGPGYGCGITLSAVCPRSDGGIMVCKTSQEQWWNLMFLLDRFCCTSDTGHCLKTVGDPSVTGVLFFTEQGVLPQFPSLLLLHQQVLPSYRGTFPLLPGDGFFFISLCLVYIRYLLFIIYLLVLFLSWSFHSDQMESWYWTNTKQSVSREPTVQPRLLVCGHHPVSFLTNLPAHCQECTSSTASYQLTRTWFTGIRDIGNCSYADSGGRTSLFPWHKKVSV